MRQILLFLDFDGVLHHWWPREDRSDEENRHFAYLPRLEQLLRDFEEVRIVISSDWRLNRTLEELRAFFSEDIRPRIIGTTDATRPPRDSLAPRQAQIEVFLRANCKAETRWLALDDDAENFRVGAPLVLCADEFAAREEALLREMLLRLRDQT